MLKFVAAGKTCFNMWDACGASLAFDQLLVFRIMSTSRFTYDLPSASEPSVVLKDTLESGFIGTLTGSRYAVLLISFLGPYPDVMPAKP